MDTKLKKSKLIFSFAAFFLGMSLFINSALSLIRIAAASRNSVWDLNRDYQDTDAFRDCISDYLEAFLGVATGGKGWKYYGLGRQYGDSVYGEYTQSDVLKEYYDILSGTGDIAAEQAEIWLDEEDLDDEWYDEIPEEAYALPEYEISSEAESPSLDWRCNYRDGSWSPSSEKNFMREISYDKNIRYGIIYQNKLLYTNIDELESETGKAWDSLDLGQYLSPEEYNFTLWFNKDGDGKTRIFKSGAELEIYGNGMYSADKRWFVPGYDNFNADKAAGDAVVFLAAAREPKLYVTGNYSEYGTSQNGGCLYFIWQDLQTEKKQFQNVCTALGLSLFFFLLSFLLRKERRLACRSIGRLTGRLWLEWKFLLFFLLPLGLLLGSFSESVSDLVLLVRYDTVTFRNVLDCLEPALKNGIPLTICFWLFYLGLLDKKANKGHQKKPLLTWLRSGDLSYPIQKRMIRRYRLAAVSWLLAPLLCLSLLFLIPSGNSYLRWILITFPLPVFLFAAAYLALCAVSILFLKKNRRLAEDLGAFFDQVDTVREGDLAKPLVLPEDTDLKEAADSLNAIRQGLETALKEQLRSEQMKVELVTNVSHDIKTPLTSIISYVELLKQEEELPEHVKEFIQILGEKSERLKTIVQDVFEVSRAASGQLPVEPERLDLGKLLLQTLADMDSQIAESGLLLKRSIPEEPVFIFADGERLYRVFQNLIQNALSYSLKGSRVFLTLTVKESVARAVIRNTSAIELNEDMDFSERFVRGDKSRSDGGSGLGLSIAKSFTEACGGTLRILVDADLFTVTVAFPVCQDGPHTHT